MLNIKTFQTVSAEFPFFGMASRIIFGTSKSYTYEQLDRQIGSNYLLLEQLTGQEKQIIDWICCLPKACKISAVVEPTNVRDLRYLHALGVHVMVVAKHADLSKMDIEGLDYAADAVLVNGSLPLWAASFADRFQPITKYKDQFHASSKN